MRETGSALPLNFSAAWGDLFLSGCHFSAALRYAFLISSWVAVGDIPVDHVSTWVLYTRELPAKLAKEGEGEGEGHGCAQRT